VALFSFTPRLWEVNGGSRFPDEMAIAEAVAAASTSTTPSKIFDKIANSFTCDAAAREVKPSPPTNQFYGRKNNRREG
jgi:hypothetical protein